MITEKSIEEVLRDKATTNSDLYRDAIARIRDRFCPMYVGVPENVSLTDQFKICNTCMDSDCYHRG